MATPNEILRGEILEALGLTGFPMDSQQIFQLASSAEDRREVGAELHRMASEGIIHQIVTLNGPITYRIKNPPAHLGDVLRGPANPATLEIHPTEQEATEASGEMAPKTPRQNSKEFLRGEISKKEYQGSGSKKKRPKKAKSQFTPEQHDEYHRRVLVAAADANGGKGATKEQISAYAFIPNDKRLGNALLKLRKHDLVFHPDGKSAVWLSTTLGDIELMKEGAMVKAESKPEKSEECELPMPAVLEPGSFISLDSGVDVAMFFDGALVIRDRRLDIGSIGHVTILEADISKAVIEFCRQL